MSLVDEVLAEHVPCCEENVCDACYEPMPCPAVRLALALQSAEKALRYIVTEPGIDCRDAARAGLAALAEHDKGGQG